MKDVLLIHRCPRCGQVNQMIVSKDNLDSYKNGTLIEDAFPDLTAEERHFIKSGHCFDCSKLLFKEREEKKHGRYS